MIWTLLRHITNGINFDVVGQVGLVEQWAQGLSTGAQIGPTNYVVKMPLYFLVNGLDFLSQPHKLLLLAFLCNIAAYVVIFKLMEAVTDLYDKQTSIWLYLGLAWLATIAGSVFWVDYANSRNLEIAGGLLLMYLALRYVRQSRMYVAALLLLAGGLVFFADPLQLYIVGVAICLFAGARWLVYRRQQYLRDMLVLVSAMIGAAFLSKLLFILSAKVLPLSYLAVPSPRPELTIQNVLATAEGMFVSTFKIFDADFAELPVGINSIRELFNAVVLCAIVAGVVKMLLSGYRNAASMLALAVVGVNFAVFAASGQALQWETSRYLILVPVMAVLFVGLSGDRIIVRGARLFAVSWTIGLIVSSVLLIGALVVSWPTRYQKDAPIAASVAFMRANGFRYAVSTREVAIPATYFTNGETTIVPVLCGAGGQLQETYLFFDRAAFSILDTHRDTVPLIVPGAGIGQDGLLCDREDIIRQYGQPLRELPVPSVGTALVYPASSLR
jgi:hypothetical protein